MRCDTFIAVIGKHTISNQMTLRLYFTGFPLFIAIAIRPILSSVGGSAHTQVANRVRTCIEPFELNTQSRAIPRPLVTLYFLLVPSGVYLNVTNVLTLAVFVVTVTYCSNTMLSLLCKRTKCGDRLGLFTTFVHHI